MAMKLNTKLLGEVRELVNEKIAFVPMAGGDPAAMGAPPPGDPAAMGAPPMDPAAGGMPPPGDPAAMGAPPMDPAAGGMPPPPPMDPAAGGMPPPPVSQSGMINMTVDEFMKFIKQIVALCTSGKFGNDPKPTDGGPVSDGQAVVNAKLDNILNAIQG
jgi:hypothetical protein